MILRSIEVQGWRCFADPVRVGPFADGLNILSAPNAFGKSTIFEALRRALFDGHRVGGREVEALRPWGRSLAPAVTIEFSADGAEYRLAKSFLERASSNLSRKEGGAFVRLHEGDAADEYVRTILEGESPGRGLSRPGHWGLAQVLLVPQGQMALEELSGNLVANIQQALGAQVSGPGTGPLEQKIEALYLRSFSPTGKVRSGRDAPPCVNMQKRLEELRKEMLALLNGMEAFENASRRVEDLRAQRVQATRDAESIQKVLRETRAGAQVYATLLAERDKRELHAASAKERHASLKQHIDGIEKARKEREEARTDLERLKADAPARAKEVLALEGQAEKAKVHLEEVRKERATVEKAAQEAHLAQEFAQAMERLAGTESLILKIRQAEQDLSTSRRELSKVIAPDSKALQAIRKAVKARDDAQVRLDAALITLEIVPESPGILEILSGEEPCQKKISPGKALEVKGAPEVVVDWKGIARIRARGPEGSVGELREALVKATRQMEKFTSEFRSVDLEELEALYSKAETMKQKVSDADTRMNTLLSGRSIEEIEKDRTKAAKVVDEILESHPAWRTSPPDADTLRAEAKEIHDDFISRVDQAEARKDTAQKALLAGREKNAMLEAHLSGAERRVKSFSEKVQELENDGRDDRRRAEELQQIALEWDAARSALETIQRDLGEFKDDPRRTLEKIEKQLNELQNTATQALSKQKEEEGRLEQLASGGPYSTLSLIEEQMGSLEEDIAREDLRLNATRLLHDTVRLCRAEMLSKVTRPVEGAATRILERIAGARLGTVRLAEELRPQGVAPKVLGTEVPVDELSGGEKEQVHLAVRLALAEVLSKDERHLAVLDDVLTATDTSRLARILTILEEAAQRLQLLILTCHPERYRGLADAKFFDLEELRGTL